jgi:hypothetical protein
MKKMLTAYLSIDLPHILHLGTYNKKFQLIFHQALTKYRLEIINNKEDSEIVTFPQNSQIQAGKRFTNMLMTIIQLIILPILPILTIIKVYMKIVTIDYTIHLI